MRTYYSWYCTGTLRSATWRGTSSMVFSSFSVRLAGSSPFPSSILDCQPRCTVPLCNIRFSPPTGLCSRVCRCDFCPFCLLFGFFYGTCAYMRVTMYDEHTNPAASPLVSNANPASPLQLMRRSESVHVRLPRPADPMPQPARWPVAAQNKFALRPLYTPELKTQYI